MLGLSVSKLPASAATSSVPAVSYGGPIPRRCLTNIIPACKPAARLVNTAVAAEERGSQLQPQGDTGSGLDQLRVVDLQQMLGRLGLPKSGTKASLLQRLRGHLESSATPAENAVDAVAEASSDTHASEATVLADSSSRLHNLGQASTSNGSSQTDSEPRPKARGRKRAQKEDSNSGSNILAPPSLHTAQGSATSLPRAGEGSSAGSSSHSSTSGGGTQLNGLSHDSSSVSSSSVIDQSRAPASQPSDSSAPTHQHTALSTSASTSLPTPTTSLSANTHRAALGTAVTTVGKRSVYLPHHTDEFYRVSRSRRRNARDDDSEDDESGDNQREMDVTAAFSTARGSHSSNGSKDDDGQDADSDELGFLDLNAEDATGTDRFQGQISTAQRKGAAEQDKSLESAVGPDAEGSAEAPAPVSAMEGLTDADIPPFPERWRGISYVLYPHMLAPGNYASLLNSNPAGLQLTFLGTASHRATHRRSLSSIVLCRGKDLLMFDAGDDTQRGMSHQMHVKPSKIYRVFLTSLTADCLLGLPGLLCCICAARLRGHEIADIPIHVFGPPGLAEYLSVMFKVSNTFLETPILVHEFSFKPVDELDTMPGLFNRRAKIWRALMPPDQLNPQGFIDGDLARIMPTQGRATQGRGKKAGGGVLAYDPRAGYLAFPEPVPGDATRTDLAPGEATWTIQVDLSAQVVCKALRAPQPTMAYVYKEADRVGALSMDRCEALGVIPGDDFSRLKRGESVYNNAGKVVDATMVVAPDKPGRKVAIVGSCLDASHAADVIAGADVLVYGCGLSADGGPTEDAPAEWAGENGQPRDDAAKRGPAAAAGRMAQELNVQHLVLTKFDGRPMLTCNSTKPLEPLVHAQLLAARQHLDKSKPITAMKDNWTLVVDKHEGHEHAPEGVELVPALSMIAQLIDPDERKERSRPPRGGRGGVRGGGRFSHR